MSERPAFSIRVHGDGPVEVVSIRGEVTLRSVPELHAALLEVVQRRPERLILDLSEVPYMDSSGIGTLVEIKRRLEKQHGQLVLAALQPRVRGLFEITRLVQFFTIAGGVDEARGP